MLALDRPLGVVAGVALFGDHAEAARVYVVPTRPRLATIEGVPELSFVRFRPEDAAEGGVGLLSFTTELVVTDEQLEQVRDHLERQGLTEPVFAQVPWVGGQAYLAAALAEGDGFVERLFGQVTPDLAAANRAMFSARLNEDGARLVEGLVSATGPSPLGVRYELEYLGLRPALDVRVHADYKRVYDELSWGFEVGVAYQGVGVRASVESATQKLREAGAIQIEVLHFTDDADLQRRVDEAVQWLQDRILEDFFTSSLEPPAHDNLLERAIAAAARLGAASLGEALGDASLAGRLAEELGVSPDALQRLAGAGGTGAAGAGNQSGFALKLQFTFRDIHQEELKSITLDWTEAHAERRTAAPQGLLSSFGRDPRIVDAEASGEFWDSLHVNVRPLGNFTELGVLRLVAQLAYPDEEAPEAQKAFTFEASETDPRRFSAWTNGRPPRYRGRTEVHFDEHGPWPGPPVFSGPWRTLESLDLGVHPLSDVPRVELEIAPGTLRFEEVPQAQVDLRIDGVAAGTRMITAEHPSGVLRRRLSGTTGTPDASDAAPVTEARLTWFLSDGRRVEGEWETVDGGTFLVHAPWQSTRRLRVLPVLPDDIIEAVVTVTMHDSGRTETTDLRFGPGDRQAQSVALPALSATPPPVRIDTLVIRGDGSTFVAAPVETSDPVVIIRDRDGAFRQVSVRLLAGESLASHGLMAVDVQLLGAGDEAVDHVVFTESQREPARLLVPADDGLPPPRYRVIRFGLDGTASPGAPAEITAGELLVPAVVRP